MLNDLKEIERQLIHALYDVKGSAGERRSVVSSVDVEKALEKVRELIKGGTGARGSPSLPRRPLGGQERQR